MWEKLHPQYCVVSQVRSFIQKWYEQENMSFNKSAALSLSCAVGGLIIGMTLNSYKTLCTSVHKILKPTSIKI